MNDLISRQDAIDEIEYELEMINSALDSITLDFNARERLRQRRGEAREILNSIQQLPSAQPDLSSYSDKLWRNAYERGKAEAQAEIVRCKDCKWKQGAECVSFADVRPWPNDFCSRAERRNQ